MTGSASAAVALAALVSALYSACVTATERELIVRRFQLTLALFELGEAMMRQRLRRQTPDATAAEIDRKVEEWLQRRPGAETGDCPGRRRPWPAA